MSFEKRKIEQSPNLIPRLAWHALILLAISMSVLTFSMSLWSVVSQPPAVITSFKMLEPIDIPAGLGIYEQANEELGQPRIGEQRVVFLGDSIVRIWSEYFAEQFPGRELIGRGIDSQTTRELLIRFRQDVVNLSPKVLVILAGTNDLDGIQGDPSIDVIQNNIASMTDIALANNIKVILVSILPRSRFFRRPGTNPTPEILAVNSWMKSYARLAGVEYVDCYSALLGDDSGIRTNLSSDGIHPNREGYAIMAVLVERAIRESLVSR